MAILYCSSSSFVTDPQVLAAAAAAAASSPISSNLSNEPAPSISPLPRLKTTQVTPPDARKIHVKLRQTQGGQQPTILEIERAIGAGIFKDRDDFNSEEAGEKASSSFNDMLQKGEGSVEKKLRDTGEWLTDQAERTSRSAGKQILMAMFLWIIPAWMLLFVAASGIIRLPFQIPLLEDLLS